MTERVEYHVKNKYICNECEKVEERFDKAPEPNMKGDTFYNFTCSKCAKNMHIDESKIVGNKVKILIPQHKEFKAIQWTGENYKDICNYIWFIPRLYKEKDLKIPHLLLPKIAGDKEIVKYGDFIYLNEDGYAEKITYNEFMKYYKIKKNWVII